MTEESDNPNVSGVVQSTPMESLNDELTPNTDEPDQDPKVTKKDSIKTKLYQHVQSLNPNSKVNALKLENETLREKMNEMESELEKKEMACEIKLKTDMIEFLNKKLNEETANSKRDKDHLNEKLDRLNEKLDRLNDKLDRLNDKLDASRMETKHYMEAHTEKKIQIVQLEYEAKLKSTEMETETNSKVEEIDRLKKELEDEIARSKRETDELKERLRMCLGEIDRYKTELVANASRMTEMDDKIKSKSEKIDELEEKMEREAKLKAVEIENLKLTQEKNEVEWKSVIDKLNSQIDLKKKDIENLQKTEAECKSVMTKLESDIASKTEEIDTLKRKSEDEIASLKIESDKLHEDLKGSRKDIDRCKEELKERQAEFEQYKVKCQSEITKMECEAEKKWEEIENLKKDSDAKIVKMENLKDDEINILKKREDELITRIVQLEDEAKAAKIRENCTPTEFTIHSKFTEISKLEDDEKVFSSPTVSAGITWKVSVQKWSSSIEFYLYAEKKDSVEWLCPVMAELRVISPKSEENVNRKESELIFDAEKYSNKIGRIWIDNKEFVVDDSITVAVAIKAFPRNLHEATKISLRFQFSDISKLEEWESVYSEPTEVDGITWKMSVEKDDYESITVFLNAEKKDAVEWLCAVIVDFQLESQTSGEMVHITRAKRMYDGDDIEDIGYISKEDLNNEEKGFVLDDSIIVVMDITPFPIN